MKTKATRKRRGATLLVALGAMFVLAIAAGSFIDSTNSALRVANRQRLDVQTTHVSEAGVQRVLLQLWRNFKSTQSFDDMVAACTGASYSTPKATQTGTIPSIGTFAASVISFTQPLNAAGQLDTYNRDIVIRAVGFIDKNSNGTLDNGEARKTIDVSARFSLKRSQVFDYQYFANNYGWMDGFNANDLIMNGDCRANGDFNFLNGSPTVNGSVFASANSKLSPAAAGIVNTGPVKWNNATYAAAQATNQRMRQVFNEAAHGAKGTTQYEGWRDFVYDTNGSVVNNQIDGSVIGDVNGLRSWQRTTQGTTPNYSVIDTRPTEEVIMPDLSDLNRYVSLSQSYIDSQAIFPNGTANPNFNTGASVYTWNTSTNSYQRIDTNGVVTGSAALVGTATNPIKIHGPVTFTQDAVIKGYVQGQGTIYTGRNIHIVGSIRYKSPPDFRGSDPTTVDNNNSAKDMLGLAARGSVIMGNTSQFRSPYPLAYMTPPFTKGRYDDLGNWIPPYNANAIDATGKKLYQSTLGDTYINSIAESVNQIDAVLYTNFIGGGNIGTGGGGVTFNGSIISKDESMVVFSLPMYCNYDNRIRERTSTQKAVIDLQLPRSPVMFRSTWQDKGFSMHN